MPVNTKMIKRILFILLAFMCLSFSPKRKISQNYFSIYAPADFPVETLADYTHLLNLSTNKSWKIATGENEVQAGIILKIADNRDFNTKESFRLQSNGKTLLTISSSSTEGLIFGLYKHLRSLGFKFYLPDDLYTIIPVVTNPFGLKKDIIDKPFVQIRNFAGTGGLGSTIPDPDKSVEKSWILWKIRNGFGSTYRLSGHRGEDFILENKIKLQQNPQWLASPFTNTYLSDQTTKINYQNKDAVNFYVDWTLKPFLQSGYKLPPPGHPDFVSIEPSDGGGYLNDFPNAKKNLPSISDQVYGMANLAAQKLDKLFPDHPNIGVNLYAYNTHAEPPSFPLNPRVFVQLVPYQFQNIAYGPSFIKLWASKVKRFGLYDYLKYTDSQFDVPGGLTLDEAMKRLIQSVKSGSEGTTYETSYSKFSTGIPLWLMGCYMADGNANWQKNLSELVNDLYKNAKEPIGKLFTLFYSEASFNKIHMANAIALVEKAAQASTDPLVQNRVTELKEYLQFVHLVYQSRNVNNGTLKERLVPVTEYAWKIYETKIIHSYRIMALVSYSFSDVSHQLQQDWFPETERSKTEWGKIPQSISSQQIEKDFQSLKNSYKKSEQPQAYTFNDVRQAMTNKYKPQKKFVIGGDYIARGYFGISAEKPTEIRIKYILSNNSSSPKATISAIDNNYSSPLAFPLEKTSGELKFSVPAGETIVFISAFNGTAYRMQVNLDDGLIYFDGSPRGIMGFFKNLTDPAVSYEPAFYPSYIFFPRDVPTIKYKAQINNLSITSPSGKQQQTIPAPSEGYEVRQFTIDKTESGKIWKAVINGNYNYSFLNIPDRYYLLEEK